MSLAPLLGSVGLGLAWGWLIGLRGAAAWQPWWSALALLGATLVLALEVWLFAGGWALGVFTGGATAAWAGHTAWRRSLHRRFGEGNHR